jgi:hypothetical protein
MGKGATARCLVCENRNGFVGKHSSEKITEVSRRLKRLLNN